MCLPILAGNLARCDCQFLLGILQDVIANSCWESCKMCLPILAGNLARCDCQFLLGISQDVLANWDSHKKDLTPITSSMSHREIPVHSSPNVSMSHSSPSGANPNCSQCQHVSFFTLRCQSQLFPMSACLILHPQVPIPTVPNVSMSHSSPSGANPNCSQCQHVSFGSREPTSSTDILAATSVSFAVIEAFRECCMASTSILELLANQRSQELMSTVQFISS